MRKKLLTAVVGSALAVSAGAANAIDLKVSGHVYRLVMWADDGISSETFHVDGTTAPTRIRFTASDDIFPGVKAGAYLEYGANSNPSGGGAGVSQPVKNVAANGNALGERWAEVFLQGSFGKLAIGQGEAAAKDTVGQDISGTGLAASGAPADIGGSLFFRTATGGNGPILNNVLNNFDGAANGGRYDRLRYDTPSLGGLVISGSFGSNTHACVSAFDATVACTQTQDDKVEAGAKFNSAVGGGKLAAAVGYAKNITGGSDVKQETMEGSVSWLSSFGLSVTAAYAQREDENPVAASQLDGSFWRVKLGWLAGEHAFSVHYAVGEDQRVGFNDEATQIGAEWVWTPKPWANIVAGVHTNSLDSATTAGVTTEYDDLLVVFAGMRVVF